MESDNVFKEAYDHLGQIEKENHTDSVLIDYSKLDDKSKGELKDLITRFVNRRRGEVYKVIFTTK